MAGEIEEPFSVNFQAATLHSSSVSFGRYETEGLCWERRSSFTHNRYLEEVERYSKPGSVTEKKAYFEAHFKKKGIRFPGSFGGQNEKDYKSADRDVFDNVGFGEDGDNVNEMNNYAHFDVGVVDHPEDERFVGGGGCDDSALGSDNVTHFDESPETSEHVGGFDLTECEVGLDNANLLAEGVHEDTKYAESFEKENGRDKVNAGQEMEIKVNANVAATNAHESSRPIDPSPRSGKHVKGDKTSPVGRQNLSPKSRLATENKAVKSRLKSHVNASQGSRNIHSTASRSVSKNENTREKETPLRVKLEKQSAQGRTPKKEDSESSSTRSNLGNKSYQNESKLKKVAQSPASGSNRAEGRARQSPNRPKQTVISTKLDTKANVSSFNFRSGERAERRKEEKTEAEIKQLRRGLNFKATPMPSFYHSTGRTGCDGGKAAVSGETKHHRVSQKSTSIRREPVKATECSTTDPSASNHIDQEAITTENNGLVMEHEKRTMESRKTPRDHRDESKPRRGSNKNSMVRKSVKGIGIGRLAVGVAS